jgi:hypothetical protein
MRGSTKPGFTNAEGGGETISGDDVLSRITAPRASTGCPLFRTLHLLYIVVEGID